MKYIKTFESFSPVNEEEEIFGSIKRGMEKAKKLLQGDLIEDQLKIITVISKKDENEVRKVIDQIKSEKDLLKKDELLKELIGDYTNNDVRKSLIRMGVKTNEIRYELGCMTPEEKEEFEARPGGSTGWEGSRGFH
jgi:hypothetical protein